MKKIAGAITILLFFLSFANAQEPKYTNNSFARLSYITGNTYIQRAADLEYEEGVVNMPITEGDRLGTTDGRAEIFIGKGNYVRLDHNTKIDFLNLPKKGDALIQIQIWSGNVYFSINSLEKEKDIEIHTPDVSVYVLDTGLYRIDMRENAETEIFVFNGLVETAGETGSVLIKDGQRLEAIEGRFTSRPTKFMAAIDDSFDRWNEYRDSQIRKHLAKQYLPEELEDFEYELAEYGDWTYVSPYGNVWVPGGVGVDWRPYYNGRWLWIPLSGWTWLPYEPWGWATFHYGRWHWSIGVGWYWIPTTIWGPGWVGWYSGYGYYGWAPMSYWGYPGVIINNMYYGRYSRSYYPYNSRALTVIHKNQLRARNVSKVALSQDSVKKLGEISLSKKAPAIRPSKGSISVQKLDGKKVFLHSKDSAVKYEPGKRVTRTSSRKPGPASVDSKSIKKDTARNIKATQERKIIKKRTGYSSSPSISVRNYSKIKTKKSSSTLSRIYNYISGKSSSKYIKSSSSQSSSRGTTSKKINSSSRSKSSRSTSSRTSSRSSSSGKVKKKK